MKNAPKQWPRIYQRLYVTGRIKWTVDCGVVDGKRLRRAFDGKTDADTYAEQKRIERSNEGTMALALSWSVRNETASCLAKLQPYNASLSEATDYFVSHVLRYRTAPAVWELLDRLMADKREAGRRLATLHSLQGFTTLFTQRFGSRQLNSVTLEELKTVCLDPTLAPRSQFNRIRLARQVYNYAKEHGWIGENLPAKLVAPSQDEKEPGILTVAQAHRLLALAGEFELLGYVAIGLFAGVRSAEMFRLDWSRINRGDREIIIDGFVAKTRARRVIPYDEALAAWLELCPQRRGPIVEKEHFERRFRRLRQAAGIQTWPHNALRHSFASYHLARHQNPVRTAFLLGHHAGSDMLDRHYKGLVSGTAAAAFWNLTPTISATQPLRQTT